MVCVLVVRVYIYVLYLQFGMLLPNASACFPSHTAMYFNFSPDEVVSVDSSAVLKATTKKIRDAVQAESNRDLAMMALLV